MRKLLLRLLALAVPVLLWALAAPSAQASELMALETSSVLLSVSTGCPQKDAGVRTVALTGIPADFEEHYAVQWYSGEESVATVTENGTIHAVQPGKTSVYCEVTRQSTGKQCAVMAVEVTVQEGGSGVTVSGAPEENSMRVGDTFDFNRKIRSGCGADVTDATVWVCSDPAVASVTPDGVATALKGGTFTVWACTENRRGEVTAVSDGVTVTVTTGIRTAEQRTANTVELTFAQALPTGFTASDFTVREKDGTLLGVMEAKIAADRCSAVVKTYAALREETVYFISARELGSASFTATVAAAEKVQLVTTRVEAGIPTMVEFALLDEKGNEKYRGSGQENLLTEGDRAELRLLDTDADADLDGMEVSVYGLGMSARFSIRYYPTGSGTYVESAPTRITTGEGDKAADTETAAPADSTGGTQVSVTGGVQWVDDGISRPEKVTLTLYADGTEKERVEVSYADGWSHTWSGLSAGAVYTVETAAPEGYFISKQSDTEGLLYTAQLESGSASAGESGTVSVTYSGTLSQTGAEMCTVTDAVGAAVAVSAASVEEGTLYLTVGTLSPGTYTVSCGAALGSVTVTVGE